VFAERAAFLPADDVLVVADLHVGRGEASAVSFPVGEREDLLARLERLLSRFDPARVVVAGDVVHTFSAVTDRSRETLTALARPVRRAEPPSNWSQGITIPPSKGRGTDRSARRSSSIAEATRREPSSVTATSRPPSPRTDT